MSGRKSIGEGTLAVELGAKVINDSSEHVIDAAIINLSADAIVEELDLDGAPVTISNYITSPLVATGMFSTISDPNKKNFTRIKLSTGSANTAT